MNSRARARRMRDYERSTDHAVPSGQYVVARLDGRGFSKLTREQGFQHPFDPAFRAAMVSTTQHLMKCGPQVILGYTQSDEISLLFHPECRSFGRRSAKLLSVLAGEASAVLSLALGVPSVFDCRLSCLPSRLLAVEYFQWRIADSVRNSLQARAHDALRASGHSVREAHRRLSGMKARELQALSHQGSGGADQPPTDHDRGTGIWWVEVARDENQTDLRSPPTATRRVLHVDPALPADSAGERWLFERIPTLPGSPAKQ